MKKALCDLTFIVMDLDRAILKYKKTIMPKKELKKLRLLKQMRDDLKETLRIYCKEFKSF